MQLQTAADFANSSQMAETITGHADKSFSVATGNSSRLSSTNLLTKCQFLRSDAYERILLHLFQKTF